MTAVVVWRYVVGDGCVHAMLPAASSVAVCGFAARAWLWLGTGSAEEYGVAVGLPACAWCAEVVGLEAGEVWSAA